MISSASTPGAERHVDAISDQFVEESAAADPIMATYLGIAGYDDQLPDLSPDGFANRAQLGRTALAAVAAADPIDNREQVAKDAFCERVGLEVERDDAHITQTQVSVIASWFHGLREMFDLMDTETEPGWESIDARMAGIPQAIADYRRTLAEEADAGYVSSRQQLVKVAKQFKGWTGEGENGKNFFLELAARAEVGDTLSAQVARHAQQASQAFSDLADFLVAFSSRGRDKEAVGREEYALDSRYFLGAAVDLDETYAWGWQELERLDDAMREAAGKIVPGGSIPDAVATLDADPRRVLEGTDKLREWMQSLADKAIADLGDVHFDIPEPIRTIECRIAPTGDGGIYYTGPSEDFSRPGRMWWDVPPGVTEFATWKETTTVYHEGVPGHHLQVAQTIYRRELLNRWQRLMCWVSGHGEGWALYSERLMDDLGYLADPGDKLGMLDGQSLRAARVIVDIGMHLELEIPTDNPFGFHPGERWNPEYGFEFMRQHCLTDDKTLRYEVDRYLGWPGQAPSYKVGERIWLQARDDARVRHGDRFDLHAFHRRALDLGPMGLDPFREALARL